MKAPAWPPPIAAAFLASILLLSGCGRKQSARVNGGAQLPTAHVTVEIVQSKSRPMTEEVVATVRAKLHATLEAKLNGRIETMPVALGDKIHKGDLIARLDAAEIAARLQQAEAAADQARRDWKRVSSLFEQQDATQSEYDAAKARLSVAEATMAEAKAMAGYIEIVAPFDAVVATKWADVGDLATPGKPLVEIEDPSTLQLEADIPEAIASRVERGAQLEIRTEALTNCLIGVVSEIAPSADPVSRTVRVKLDLKPSDGLKSGQFARLVVPIGESNSLRVPNSAVVQRGQMEIVFVLQNQCARMHLVKTGKHIGTEVEILSGLDPGDSVIVTDPIQLTDGQPVEAK